MGNHNVQREKMTSQSKLLRQIPAVEHLLRAPQVSALFSQAERPVVSHCAGDVLRQVRASIISGEDQGVWFMQHDGENGSTRRPCLMR